MLLNFIIQSFRLASSIYENKTHADIVKLTIMLGDVLLFGGLFFALFQTRDMTYLSSIIAFIFCTTFGTGLRYVSKFEEKMLKRIMSRISNNSDWPSFIDEKLHQRAETQMERNSRKEITCLFFALTYCLYSPYFYFITKPGITFDHPDLQVVPYFYPFWKTRTLQQHLTKRFFEMVINFSCMVVYLSFTVFIIYAVANVEEHIKEINYLLENSIMTRVRKYMKMEEVRDSHNQPVCQSYVLRNSNQEGTEKFVKSAEDEFVQIIKYHQLIHRHITDITTFLQKPFSMMFVWYISSTVLFIFEFLQMKNDYVVIIRTISLVVHAVLALHLYCNVAHTIYKSNELIMDSFYNTSWYYFAPQTRKHFLFILALSQRKYEVKCFGMHVVNLNLFLYGLRIVYTVINLIRVTQRK